MTQRLTSRIRYGVQRCRSAIVIALCAYSIGGNAASIAGQQRSSTPPQPAQSPRAITPEEHAHAILHDRGFENKPRLTETLAIFVPVGRPGANGPSYEAFLTKEICAADLVIQGTVVSARSMLNSSETFVFTDTIVKPEIVYRSKRPSGDGPITVTRLGGEVVLDGRKIAAGYVNDPSLVRGRRYILLLQSLSSGRDYENWPNLTQIEDQGRQVVFAPLGKWSPDVFFTRTFKFADVQADVKRIAAGCR